MYGLAADGPAFPNGGYRSSAGLPIYAVSMEGANSTEVVTRHARNLQVTELGVQRSVDLVSA